MSALALQRRYRFLLTAALLVAAHVVAAPAPAEATKTILTVNPLGLLQFGPTIELERLGSPEVGIAFGLARRRSACWPM